MTTAILDRRTLLLGALASGTVAGGALLAAPTAAAMDADPIYTGRFSNLAVGGYDPVAYFTEGAPTKGSRAFETRHLGATWRFASEANRDAFRADPARFAPRYGGYCAWAAADGRRAKGDPEYWKIVDGKLYLNFNAKIQELWEADIPGFIARADAQWPELLRG